MRKRRLWGYAGLAPVIALIIGIGVFTGQAMAETSSSANYQITETQFGNASTTESCSDQYCAHVTIGDDGQTSSASTPELGKADYSEPLLEMSVEPGQSNLGELTTEHTGTKTMTVKIRNYLSDGYMLQIVGTPPKYGNHTLDAPSTPTISKTGTEQFGINVVANTSPSIGANPVLQPSGSDGSSLVSADYKTPNVFKYVSGDTVAFSPTNNGGADFTITMMVNISNSTPAGHYSGDFAAVVLPYY